MPVGILASAIQAVQITAAAVNNAKPSSKRDTLYKWVAVLVRHLEKENAGTPERFSVVTSVDAAGAVLNGGALGVTFGHLEVVLKGYNMAQSRPSLCPTFLRLSSNYYNIHNFTSNNVPAKNLSPATVVYTQDLTFHSTYGTSQ